MNSVCKKTISQQVVIVMTGITKVFVGELVETGIHPSFHSLFMAIYQYLFILFKSAIIDG